MKVQLNYADMWGELKRTKGKNEKKVILNKIINEPKNWEDEDIHLTPKLREMNKQINKLNLKDIASKVARGEYVNDKELMELGQKDPDLLAKSKCLNVERKRIENKVRNTRSMKKAKDILQNEKQAAISLAMAGISSTSDGGATGMIMISAVKKAEENTNAELKRIDKVEKQQRKKEINK